MASDLIACNGKAGWDGLSPLSDEVEAAIRRAVGEPFWTKEVFRPSELELQKKGDKE